MIVIVNYLDMLIHHYLDSSIFFIFVYQKLQILQIVMFNLDIITNYYLESSLSAKYPYTTSIMCLVRRVNLNSFDG